MWTQSSAYYAGAAYAPGGSYAPPLAYGPTSASPRSTVPQPGALVPAGHDEQQRVNPNCAGNDVGACIGRCRLCTGGCSRGGNKCMACVGGCQGVERAGYCLGHPLCEGRYGFVRTATKDGKTYAMKVIPIDKFTRSEIELQTILPDHPHIVQVYEAFKTENVIILVLEYCQHGDLFEFMQKRREEHKGQPMEESQVRNFFLQILSPVRDLHQLHVAHHDIKLENYLLTHGKMGKLTLKVADFGAAERLERSSITTCRKGHISPEKKTYINTGRPYCAYKSDLYQLGSALHEVAFEMREPRADGAINPPEHYPPSPELRDLLNRLVVLDPRHRLSMEEVLSHPWVVADPALYERIMGTPPPGRAPTPGPAPGRARSSDPPSGRSSRPPTMNGCPPTPAPMLNGNATASPVIPRLPIGASMGEALQAPHGAPGPSPYRPASALAHGPPPCSAEMRSSRIQVTPRKQESPRLTVHSARSSATAVTPRPLTPSTGRTLAPIPRPEATPPQASAVSLRPPSPGISRPPSGGGALTVPNHHRFVSPAGQYQGYGAAALAPYSYPSGYAGAYSNPNPSHSPYYANATPGAYPMPTASSYSSRESITSPRFYGGPAPAPAASYGSYLVADGMRPYSRMGDASPFATSMSTTPRPYYS